MGMTGEIISRFEEAHFTLEAMKMGLAEEETVRNHHRHGNKALIDYMTSGRVAAMGGPWSDWRSSGNARRNHNVPPPDSIRADFASPTVLGRRRDTVCHSSDSEAEYFREAEIWFDENELLKGGYDVDA